MADRTIRAIFEARVSGAQKGMRDLSKDVEGTGKKVGGLAKDLTDLDKLKVKPVIDLAIDKAEKEIRELKAEIDRLDTMEATPEVLLDYSKAQVQLAAAESALKELNGRKAEMTVTADTSQAEDALDGLGDAGEDAGEGIVSGILDALKSIPIAGAVVGVGAAIGAGLLAGIAQGLDVEAGRDLFSARTGLDEETSARFGRAAGEAYANAWGDSIAANLDTAKFALQSGLIDADATDAEIEKVIASLSGLRDILGEDIPAVARAAGVMIRTGLVANSAEAFDVLVRGAQLGANASEDLLDTFTEYPTLFAKLGLSGQESMGLLVQALEAGARNSDLAADAFKEFQIRATDGSELSAEGFKLLGLSAKEMTAQIAAGGEGAKEGLDQVLDGLRGIEDPVKRNAAGVALFGTQWEDLGDVLLKVDLDTVAEDLDGVEGSAGAAERALATMSDNTSAKIEAARRNVEVAMEGIKGALAEAFGDDISGVADWISQNRAPLLEFFLSVVNGTLDMAEGFAEFGATALDTIAEVADGMATLVDAIPEFLLPNAEEIADGLRSVGDGAREGADTIREEVPAALDEVRDKVNTWTAPEILKARVHDATVAMTKDLEDFIAQVGEKDLTVTINGETVNAEEALAELTANINEEDGTVTINGDKVPAEDALDVLLALIKAGAEDVTIGAETTPAEDEHRRLLGRINTSKGSVKVNANTASAEAALKELERTRYATLRIRVAGVNSPGGQVAGPHEGGWTPMGAFALPGLNAGGWVPGKDPGYDNILWPLHSGGRTLMQPLTGDEFVVNSVDSAFWAPMLEWMNSGGRPVQTFNETNQAPVYIDKVVGLTISEVEREAAARRRRDALSPSRRGS